jgi:hypothetical protein
MEIKLPWPAFGKSEPLVTTGRPGAGDFIYVTYVDGRHVSLGHDKWGYGGARSGPIAVDYDWPQEVEIGLSSLGPDAMAVSGRPGLFIKWNGVTVFSEDAAAYPARPNEVTFGENMIGGSTTLRHFSGTIVSVARVDP